MFLTIRINLDNAAFQSDRETGTHSEAALIISEQVLDRLAELKNPGDKINLYDTNGNNVGFAKLTE